MTERSILVVAALAATVLAAGAITTPANADPQIFIQQSGSSPAGGGPNIITDTSAFTAGVAGNFTLQNPLLVIVGAYDGMGTPAISYSGGVSPATVGTYGLTAQTATFTAADSTAFAALGLSGGGSENFSNWSTADMNLGLAAPTSFSLTAFALDTSLASVSPITIDESGAAIGSYIIAYSCNAGTGSSSGCAKNGDIAETVFTNTGLVNSGGTPVPEPGSLALLGTGLIALGLLAGMRRRARRS